MRASHTRIAAGFLILSLNITKFGSAAVLAVQS